MSWAYGVNAAGREIGYSVEATCDLDGCEIEIDRGLAYACGSYPYMAEWGCGGFFCPKHLTNGPETNSGGTKFFEQLCPSCYQRWENETGGSDD